MSRSDSVNRAADGVIVADFHADIRILLMTTVLAHQDLTGYAQVPPTTPGVAQTLENAKGDGSRSHGDIMK